MRECPYRVVLEFLVVHVNDVCAHSVHEVLGVRDDQKDALVAAQTTERSSQTVTAVCTDPSSCHLEG